MTKPHQAPAHRSEITNLLDWTVKQITPVKGHLTIPECGELVECLLVKLKVLTQEQAIQIVALAVDKVSNAQQQEEVEVPFEVPAEVPTPTHDEVISPTREDIHGNAKLPPHIVRQIYSAHGTQSEIATEFGVKQSQVSLIKAGKAYRYLTQKLH
jgi:predicted XRE-type DNA-binding protein